MIWLASIIERFRRVFAVAIVALTLAALAGLTRIAYALDPYMQLDSTGPDGAAFQQLEQTFGSQMSDCVLLVQGEHVFTPEFVVGLRGLCRQIGSIEGVDRVWSLDRLPVFVGLLPSRLLPEDAHDETALARAREIAQAHPLVPGYLLSSDERSTVVLVRLSDKLDSKKSLTVVVAELRRIVREAADRSGLDIATTGTPVIRVDLLRFMQSENLRLIMVPLLIGLVVGLWIFRRPSPLIVAGIPPFVGVLWTLGASGWFNVKWTMISLAIPTVVYVVGFTDAVHLVLHMRQVVADRSLSAWEAALSAVRELGWACALTSITTAIGFGFLTLADSYAVRNLGMSCAFGAVVTFMAVIVLVPLFAATFLGRRTVANCGTKTEQRGHALACVFEWVLQHPRFVCVVGTVTTLLLATCTLGLRIDTAEGSDWIPPGCDSIEAWNAHAEAFGAGGDIQVLVDWSKGPDGYPDSLLEALADVHTVLEREPATSYPISALSLLRSGPAAMDASNKALASLQVLPSDLVGRFIHAQQHFALVNARISAGTVADNDRIFTQLDQELQALSVKYEDIGLNLVGLHVANSRVVYGVMRDLGKSLSVALIIIAMVLLIAFRSLRYGLICLIPNVLPLAAISGLLLVLDRPLNVSNGILFTICLGIAVDDTIHFVSRYRRERRAGCDPTMACRHSFDQVGRALVVTTLIFVFSFGGLLSTRLVGYHIFAILACAGFIAALVGDLLILPALLLCLGPKQKQ